MKSVLLSNGGFINNKDSCTALCLGTIKSSNIIISIYVSICEYFMLQLAPICVLNQEISYQLIVIIRTNIL